MDNGTVARGFRIPRNLDEQIDRIFKMELESGRKTTKTATIIMLLNLGIDAYYKNRSGRE